MNNDKLLELAATLQRAIDALNNMIQKPTPYVPKKGDRVEVICANSSGKGTIGERGTVMQDDSCPWVWLDIYNERCLGHMDLGIEEGHGACFSASKIRPLTPEEIAAEEQGEAPQGRRLGAAYGW